MTSFSVFNFVIDLQVMHNKILTQKKTYWVKF